MGLFGETSDEVLDTMTVKQMKAFAEKMGYDIDTKNPGFLVKLTAGGDAGQKQILRHAILLKGASPRELREFLVEYEKTTAKAKAETSDVPAPKIAKAAMLTPTLAPQSKVPLVSFEDVVGYLDQYRFISRYTDESYYEVELAGALRERFGTVIRQNPVPVGGKRLTIDLDVGGVGIELKFDVKPKALQAAVGQLQDYKAFYGEKLVLLLIATPDGMQYKNEIRASGVILVEK